MLIGQALAEVVQQPGLVEPPVTRQEQRMPTAAMVPVAVMAADLTRAIDHQARAVHPVRAQAIAREDLLHRDHLALQAGVQDQADEVVILLHDLLHQEVVAPAHLAVVRQAEALAGETKKQGHETIIDNIAPGSNIERESYSPGQLTLRLLY